MTTVSTYIKTGGKVRRVRGTKVFGSRTKAEAYVARTNSGKSNGVWVEID